MQDTSLQNTFDKPRWPTRVRPEKIRRLYETEARGLIDEKLLEEVLLAMYLRCQAILICTAAAGGRVKCFRCEYVIQRRWYPGAPGNPEAEGTTSAAEVLRCPQCSWQTTWAIYFKSFQGKKLWGGGALPAIEKFVEGFGGARTSRDKIMLIDALIHAYHQEMKHNPTRPVATQMIEGKNRDVIELLESLAYGEAAPEMKATKAAWDEKTRIANDNSRGKLRGGAN
ncbi:MAG TPA: hypothetical protein VF600_06085 [Abditibacteriaceae bacterium]